MRNSCGFASVLFLGLASSGHAFSTFTDSSAFDAAVAGTTATIDFDGTAAGTTLASGSGVGDVTFTYSITGVTLEVRDDFDTTSGSNLARRLLPDARRGVQLHAVEHGAAQSRGARGGACLHPGRQLRQGRRGWRLVPAGLL